MPTVPALIVSLAITAFAYALFPLLYANLRKRPITARKYRVFCFLFNFWVMVLFIALNGGSSSGSPFFLWTWVFSSLGKKILDERYVLLIPNAPAPVQSDDAPVDAALEYTEKFQQPTASIPVPVKAKKTKSRFCKHCGSPIDPATKKCTGCGKQYFRLPSRKGSSLVWKVVAVLSVIAVCLCIYRITQLETRLSDMQSLATEQEAKIAELSKTGESLQKRIAEKSSKVASLTGDINTLKRKNEKMEKVYDFCNDHVVVVSDDGTRKYHKIQCIYFDDSCFWAYNLEAAQQQGYKPCSFCFSRYFDSLAN